MQLFRMTLINTKTLHQLCAIAACSEPPLYEQRPVTTVCHIRRLATERSGRQSHVRSSS